ncbi:hypothetical protein CRENBAI_006887 [Crenichthys baileyi]|uniref:Uncharacterized protein n=1 Tax=Crenichthys baileyi TaxID=28760 RepID=A0AAV9R7F9_9TELE
MSVLTGSEGSEGLGTMGAGLMGRYRVAEVPPPGLMYVDRDCGNRDGVSQTAALSGGTSWFVTWHLMRRFACGVTSESHELYPTFMRQLSHCIFEVDSGDARRLTEAKRSDLGRKHGMVDVSDAEVVRRISKEEWRLHCRRRTRGAENTALLIQNLLDTFSGPAGRNTLNIPLLDDLRIQDIWDTQRRHLSCIQDPPGVQLYTQTGTLTKGGISLPVYRCARGSTSLESFHLHLDRFIPGTSASARYFQAFLVDGVVRWNEDRAAAAAPADAADTRTSLHSYSGHLKHALNQKSQRVLGHQMVEDFTKPAAYTGELIGLEYLFRQTGSVFEEINMDPDAPDEGAAVSTLEDEDEGIQSDEEDPTIFPPDSSSSSSMAASQSGPAPKSESPPPSLEGSGSQAPPLQDSSDSEEEIQGPDGQPGYQHVLKLAKALVEVRSLNGLSERRVDRLISLWQRLSERDKQRLAYPSRFQERQVKGHKYHLCILGVNSGPANWPDTSRLVEAICSQLCRLHPAATRVRGVMRTRWSLIHADYVSVRETVLASPRLMAQTTIQLFELNQRTISQWFTRRQKEWERSVLEQGVSIVPAPAVAEQPLLPAKELSLVRVGQGQPFAYNLPEEQQPGPSNSGLPPPPPPPPTAPTTQMSILPSTSSAQLPRPPPVVPRTTAYRRRKAAEAATAEAEGVVPKVKRKQPQHYLCGKCNQPKRLDTGHTRIGGVSYCATFGGKSVEEWRKEVKDKGGDQK